MAQVSFPLLEGDSFDFNEISILLILNQYHYLLLINANTASRYVYEDYDPMQPLIQNNDCLLRLD